MAKTGCVWGIDIGQCALKALRCRPHDDDPTKLTAEAFDYIEYSKILSQPEADPVELVREALQTFLKRNSVRGDKVAVSVSGQSGLARFIKLPPVESKKIPDIVKYEARQQIPFPLEDVIWDYQQMAGGSIEEGFALETEVGLFAMKRDQVWRALKPFEDADIEVDIIQLTPLSIYNFTAFDQMPDLPPVESYDPENPPDSVVVISLGTETTDLVITNGFRVWQRSLPLGGSHFTKALTKELRLTFAKAEHLKRNATQAEDPKAVFTAMRPVFSDLLTEVQRSISFFTGIDRNAKIGRVVALGNAMKLPGLQKYLSQNLGYPVTEVESYRQLAGTPVVGAANFRDNLLSFSVCYGLVIQGLNKGKISTNLLPQEIVTGRLIRDKKPWAVGAAAIVILGCTISYLSHWLSWSSAHPQKYSQAFQQAQSLKTSAGTFVTNYETAKTNLETVAKVGEAIVGNTDNRLLWPELLKAIDECLPRDPDPESPPEDIGDRNQIHIEELEIEKFADLSQWYAGVKQKIDDAKQGVFKETTVAPDAVAATAESAAPVDGAAVDPAVPADGTGTPGMNPDGTPMVEGPTGEGWVIQIKGYHFHNKDLAYAGANYLRDTFMQNLETKKIPLPVPETVEENGRKVTKLVTKNVPIKELGIGYPVLVHGWKIRTIQILDPNAEMMEDGALGGNLGGGRMPAGAAQVPVEPTIELKQFDFVLQFCWQETPLSKRLNPPPPKSGDAIDADSVAQGGN